MEMSGKIPVTMKLSASDRFDRNQTDKFNISLTGWLPATNLSPDRTIAFLVTNEGRSIQMDVERAGEAGELILVRRFERLGHLLSFMAYCLTSGTTTPHFAEAQARVSAHIAA